MMRTEPGPLLVSILEFLTYGWWPSWVQEYCEQSGGDPEQVYDAFVWLYEQADVDVVDLDRADFLVED